MTNKSGYSPLSSDTIQGITADLLEGKEKTLDSIAKRNGVSRAEVSTILKVLRRNNAFISTNPFAVVRPKSYQPAKLEAVARRKQAMIAVVYQRMRKGTPISINDLVKACGGTKKTAKEVLEYVQTRVAKKKLTIRFARKTVADQPSRPALRSQKKNLRRLR